MQALLNAASEFERRGEVRLAEWTRRAVAVAKLPMFMRSEEDVRDDDERPIESSTGIIGYCDYHGTRTK